MEPYCALLGARSHVVNNQLWLSITAGTSGAGGLKFVSMRWIRLLLAVRTDGDVYLGAATLGRADIHPL